VPLEVTWAVEEARCPLFSSLSRRGREGCLIVWYRSEYADKVCREEQCEGMWTGSSVCISSLCCHLHRQHSTASLPYVEIRTGEGEGPRSVLLKTAYLMRQTFWPPNILLEFLIKSPCVIIRSFSRSRPDNFCCSLNYQRCFRKRLYQRYGCLPWY